MDKNDYRVAEISNKTQIELTELEEQIKHETSKAVVLVAYEQVSHKN